MHRIVFLERNTFTINFPRPAFPHQWIEYADVATELSVTLREATIVIVNKSPLRAPLLAELPQLKLIAVAATGVDNIDLEFCRAHGIAVCNTRGYAIRSLPEHVLMLMLALRRNLRAYELAVESGKWQRASQFCLLDHTIHDLAGATLGIVGYGSLGSAVARLAASLRMDVLVAERRNTAIIRDGRSSFDRVLRESDVLSLHCPLTEETRNMIGAQELKQMKPTSILINTARGGLVDELSLVQALRDGIISGAGVDVLTVEPPREGSILLQANLPNLIVTPHVAWASQEAMHTLAGQLIKNLEAFVRGEPQNLV